MEAEGEPAESPEAFLTTLGEALKHREGVDLELAEILKAHVLKAVPAQNAVAEAKSAIMKLAGDRANAPKPEMANG